MSSSRLVPFHEGSSHTFARRAKWLGGLGPGSAVRTRATGDRRQTQRRKALVRQDVVSASGCNKSRQMFIIVCPRGAVRNPIGTMALRTFTPPGRSQINSKNIYRHLGLALAPPRPPREQRLHCGAGQAPAGGRHGHHPGHLGVQELDLRLVASEPRVACESTSRARAERAPGITNGARSYERNKDAMLGGGHRK